MTHDQTAGSSLIWVHIVCNIGYQSTQGEETTFVTNGGAETLLSSTKFMNQKFSH